MNPVKRITRPSVVIIGAGMAGISAARQLADTGQFEVTVLEANATRYGGRIHSFEVPESGGKVVDFGAMWIHGGSNEAHPLTRLCRQYGIETKEFHIFNPSNVLACDEDGKPFSALRLEKTIGAIGHLNETLEKRTQRIVESKLPDISVRSFLNELNQQDPKLANMGVLHIAIPALESYMGAIIDDLSLTFMDGVPNSPEHVEFPGEDLVLPFGYNALLNKIVETGPKFPIVLDRRVDRVKINEDSAKIDIVACDNQNRSYRFIADHVIVAVPLGVLKSRAIHFEPCLPDGHVMAIDRIGYGAKIKVLLVFDAVFWPDYKVLYVESKDQLILFMNLYLINGLNALIVTLDARQSILGETMADKDILNLVTQKLELIVGMEKIRNHRLVHSEVVRWGEVPFIRGAYSFGKIGMTTEDAYAIRRPILPYIFFAGEHTQWPEGEAGNVVAAYMSGMSASEEIVNLYRGGHSMKRPSMGINGCQPVSRL